MEKRRQPPQQLVIETGQEGQRIDNYLLTSLKGIPKSHVYRMLRTGEVRVNKGRIKPSYRLQSGDIVRIPPLIINTVERPRPSARLSDVVLKSLIYEDDDLIVLNKPSGIAVHSGSGINLGVVEALRVLRPEIPDLELVHRLDRATSGCLLLAKNRATLLELHDLLRRNEIDKSYLTLLKGEWRDGVQRIDIPLSKNRLQSGERMVQRDNSGKLATSYFSPIRVSRMASYMEVKLVTGRMHQIRVHAAQRGYPVAGDEKYGNNGFNRQMRKFGLTRLFLHAHRIEFELQDRRRKVVVEAPLPMELVDCLEKLRLSNGHVEKI
jgi:23S rRNA pseudouridine955/2504/2580 synthase